MGELRERMRRLARALCMTPTERIDVVQIGSSPRRWCLVGCVEGSQPLPRTAGIARLPDALDAAEAWLAPELDGALLDEESGDV